MFVTKLTEKCQTTIPAQIRRLLGLKKGDLVAFEIENNRVTVRKATLIDVEYLKSLEATLEEWNSEHDENAFGVL